MKIKLAPWAKHFDELFDEVFGPRLKAPQIDVWLVDRMGVVYLPSRPVRLKGRPREREK